MLIVNMISTDGITVQPKLKGFKGTAIKAPDVFGMTMSKEEYAKFVNEVLKALRDGFAEADEGVDR